MKDYLYRHTNRWYLLRCPSIQSWSNHVSLSNLSPQLFSAKLAPETMSVSRSKTMPIWFIPWEFRLHSCQKVIFKEVSKLPHSGGLSVWKQMEQQKLQGGRRRKVKAWALFVRQQRWRHALACILSLLGFSSQHGWRPAPLSAFESIVAINFLFSVQIIWRGFVMCYSCSLHWTTFSFFLLGKLEMQRALSICISVTATLWILMAILKQVDCTLRIWNMCVT